MMKLGTIAGLEAAACAMEVIMNRLSALVFAGLVVVPATSGNAFARAMGAGDVTVVQTATPAVVNMALWKARPPAKVGDLPRRVKTYGSGFVIDPTGIIVTVSVGRWPPTVLPTRCGNLHRHSEDRQVSIRE